MAFWDTFDRAVTSLAGAGEAVNTYKYQEKYGPTADEARDRVVENPDGSVTYVPSSLEAGAGIYPATFDITEAGPAGLPWIAWGAIALGALFLLRKAV